MNTNQPTAADMLERVGRALFGDEWAAGVAATLGVRRDTVRKWRHGSLPFSKGHPVFAELLTLVRRRRGELQQAEEELGDWLEPNRKEGNDA